MNTSNISRKHRKILVLCNSMTDRQHLVFIIVEIYTTIDNKLMLYNPHQCCKKQSAQEICYDCAWHRCADWIPISSLAILNMIPYASPSKMLSQMEDETSDQTPLDKSSISICIFMLPLKVLLPVWAIAA